MELYTRTLVPSHRDPGSWPLGRDMGPSHVTGMKEECTKQAWRTGSTPGTQHNTGEGAKVKDRYLMRGREPRATRLPRRDRGDRQVQCLIPWEHAIVLTTGVEYKTDLNLGCWAATRKPPGEKMSRVEAAHAKWPPEL